MKWYNFKNGGRVPASAPRGVWRFPHIKRAAGGQAVEVEAELAPLTVAPESPGVVNYNVPVGNPNVAAGAAAAFDPVANQQYYGTGQDVIINPADNTDYNIDYNAITEPTALTDAPQLADNYLQDYLYTSTPIDLAQTDQVAAPAETVGDHLVSNQLTEAAPWIAEDILQSNQVLEQLAQEPDSNLQLPEFNQDVPYQELLDASTGDITNVPVVDHAGTAPVVDVDAGVESLIQLDNTVPPAAGGGVPAVGGGVPSVGSPVGSYISGPGGVGVNTGIPQGGHARNAIANYLAGTTPGFEGGQGAGLSYTPGQHDAWLGQVGTDAGTIGANLNEQAAAIQAANAAAAGGGDGVDISGGGGTIDTLGGGTITADNAFEQPLAENIAGIIEEGGINPETGDPNIVAGPNVLSAADEGLFGFGSDYNEEFVENYDDAYTHAEANPTGQTTGTPLYDQGYVGLGVDPLADAVGGAINNSILGTVGSAITGEPLMADVSSLLPPEESFSNYQGSGGDDDGPDLNNDGDPTNDTGNAGWGFTSVADLFDGGGPGTSGDSYSGGFWGGSTSSGSDDGGGSDDSGSDDGTWCCTAAYKHGMPIRKIKELRKWHKSQSQLWQDGYDSYGHWIAQTLVKGSPFWSKVTEAGHTAFVEKKLTPMSALAVAVIAPGSLIVGTYKTIRRKLDALSPA